ncbi:hypothetical protein ACLIBG_07110 [Virgibacillus sp. W0181]|uniref:hypothetical protein n=1 Tax=Virgibacillus sp. W0181 TaxID=3391581 RepID=UPI003F45DE02
MRTITVGLIPSPDLPADIAAKMIGPLPDAFEKFVDFDVSWKVETTVDPLTGAAENIGEIIDEAAKIKKENNWDFVICLTDLPSFFKKRVVTADVRLDARVAFITLPAFGAFPLNNRIKKAILFLLDEMYSYAEGEVGEDQSNSSDLNWRFLFSKIRRIQPADEKSSSVRFVLNSRVIGWLRVLSGMTFANRPWTALVSFRKIVTLAFATGAYISIFSTPWELSVEYTTARFIILMFASIFSMVIWVIFAHNLWEKPTSKGGVQLRKLYNLTTVFTLLIIVAINYIILFILFLLALSIFVPPHLFDAWTSFKGEPSLVDYFRLAWLVTSLGTLAGAIGATGEQESRIRHITYSYRQMNRLYELEEEKNNKSNESETSMS